jgi:hypothetical protein
MRGKMTTDLLSNLFKGYKSATDERFLKYIALKEEYYEEGNNLSTYKLMSLAKNKWHVLKQKHLWNVPSPQEEKILALEAKVKKLELQQAPKSCKTKGATPQATTSTASHNF